MSRFRTYTADDLRDAFLNQEHDIHAKALIDATVKQSALIKGTRAF